MSEADTRARREGIAHGVFGAILVIGGIVALVLTVRDGLDRWTTLGAVGAIWGAVHLAMAWSSFGGRDRDEVRKLRLGWPAWALPIAIVVHLLATISLQLQRDLLPGELFVVSGWSTFLPTAMLLSLVATGALSRAALCAAETRGVARTTIGAIAALVFLIAQLAASGVIHFVSGTATRYELDLAFALPDRSALQSWLETIDTLAYGEGLSPILYTSGALLAARCRRRRSGPEAGRWSGRDDRSPGPGGAGRRRGPGRSPRDGSAGTGHGPARRGGDRSPQRRRGDARPRGGSRRGRGRRRRSRDRSGPARVLRPHRSENAPCPPTRGGPRRPPPRRSRPRRAEHGYQPVNRPSFCRSDDR